MASRATIFGLVAFLAVAAAGPWLPPWLVSLSTIAFANGLVVLGLVILWRAGLVPFGQALFYAAGAYSVALIGRYTPVRDVFVVIAAGAVAAGALAFLIGFLLARYREIFFSMLSLALSMILYGMLVKTESLGSTDGFHVEADSFLGYRPEGELRNLALFWLVLGISAIAAFVVGRYFRSVAGGLALPIRDNEIRVEFLGISVNRLVHLKLVISGVLAGIGGALAALAVGHVDPNMSYWTTSGGFVFVTILAGAGSVAAAFVGSLVFEIVRSVAVDILPGAWQIILGSVLLLTILFLPDGLGSLFSRLRRRAKPTSPPEQALAPTTGST
jgi:ABC-type branched-subunit amino acid transport system permease subunit